MKFVCIGTDRSTGDSLGPLVGTKLKQLGYDVIGTLDEPCHAMNIAEEVAAIPEGETVIAIDSMLGGWHSIGRIYRNEKKPIKPGAGVNKELPEVGDYSYSGVVNVGGFMEYSVLQNTRLSVVMKMADEIVEMILEDYPLAKLEAAAM